MIAFACMLLCTSSTSACDDFNCAVACVYAVAKEHELKLSLEDVKKLFPSDSSSRGSAASIAEVVTAVRKLGLRADAVRFTATSQLRNSTIYLVVQDESVCGHFVLLHEVCDSDDYVVIVDPLLLTRVFRRKSELLSNRTGLGIVVKKSILHESISAMCLAAFLMALAVFIFSKPNCRFRETCWGIGVCGFVFLQAGCHESSQAIKFVDENKVIEVVCSNYDDEFVDFSVPFRIDKLPLGGGKILATSSCKCVSVLNAHIDGSVLGSHQLNLRANRTGELGAATIQLRTATGIESEVVVHSFFSEPPTLHSKEIRFEFSVSDRTMPSGKFLISSIRLSDDFPLRVADHSIPVIENEFVCVSVPETVSRSVAGFFPARKLVRDEIEFVWVAKMSSPMSFDFEIPWGNNQNRTSIAFEGTESPPLGGLVKRFRFENHIDFDGEVKLPIFSGRERLDDIIEVRSSDSQLEAILQNEDRGKILLMKLDKQRSEHGWKGSVYFYFKESPMPFEMEVSYSTATSVGNNDDAG